MYYSNYTFVIAVHDLHDCKSRKQNQSVRSTNNYIAQICHQTNKYSSVT